MTRSLAHRGPDDEQVYLEEGLALGTRRLAFIDVANGRQPIANETATVWVAQEGELYEYPELRQRLAARGHVLRTQCDTEAWVHLYEDFGEDVFRHTRGQYAVSLWDRTTRTLLLGRDRAGIAPLFFAESNGWLLWASEIKALFASGLVEPRADRRGLDFFFNFFAISGARTCFEGVRQLRPGHYLRARDGQIAIRQYADIDYPDNGHERNDLNVSEAAEELEALVRDSIRRRLVGEAEFGGYLSGGIDSSMILALASQANRAPLKSFTISLDGSGPVDEGGSARDFARATGSDHTMLRMTASDICGAFPELIAAAESPVLDTSAACMIRLAQTARLEGCKGVLSGEGADEALAGYPWFQQLATEGATNPARRVPRPSFFDLASQDGARRRPPSTAGDGVWLAQPIGYERLRYSRNWLYSSQMWTAIDGYVPHDELGLDTARMLRWHPLNRALYSANKVMLAGMLLAAKGDRPMRNASIEGRFPFLDERVVDFCAQLPPSFKVNGTTDKWLLREVARKVLPASIAGRRKVMFRANLASLFLGADRPPWVDQLLSAKALASTGYFNHTGVQKACELLRSAKANRLQRNAISMGMTAVITTQLWHHIFLGDDLADLPRWQARDHAFSR